MAPIGGEKRLVLVVQWERQWGRDRGRVTSETFSSLVLNISKPGKRQQQDKSHMYI